MTMLRGSLQAGNALLSGQWSQQITKFKNGNAWHLVEKVDAFSPALWFSSASWIPGLTPRSWIS